MKILYSDLFLAQISDESIKIEEEYGAYGDHFQDIIFQKIDEIANKEASESAYTFKTDNPERDQSLNQLNWFTAQTPKFQKRLFYIKQNDDSVYFQSFYGQAQEYEKFLNKDLVYNELLSDLGLDPAKAATLYSQV